jgi:Leucine-rich repeat (LRR) protein
MPVYTYRELRDKNIIPDDCDNFNCCSLNLSKLPDLPNGLEELYCHINELTELPELPYGLIVLYCSENNLTELPVLPDGLEFLCFQYNNITELPELPNRLEELNCYCNPIKYITPDMYSIMKHIYLTNSMDINIYDTIFYDNSGCSSKAEFFGLE